MAENRSTKTMGKSQQINPRIIYLILGLLIAFQLLYPLRLPMVVGREAMGLYQAVEEVPPDKIIVIGAEWEAGTQGENAPQTEAVIRHCMSKGKKIAILGMALQGPRLVEQIAQGVAEEYERTYGVDWCNWGYKAGGENMLMAWAKDIPATIQEDARGTEISQLPMMAQVQDINDVGLIIEFTGSASLDLWLQFIEGVYKTPMGYGCTGVMGPEAYPYLDSGQLQGLLLGLKGAAEYEKLVKYHGRATYEMAAQSVAHLLIIGLIVLGNLGYLMARWRRRRGEGR